VRLVSILCVAFGLGCAEEPFEWEPPEVAHSGGCPPSSDTKLTLKDQDGESWVDGATLLEEHGQQGLSHLDFQARVRGLNLSGALASQWHIRSENDTWTQPGWQHFWCEPDEAVPQRLVRLFVEPGMVHQTLEITLHLTDVDGLEVQDTVVAWLDT